MRIAVNGSYTIKILDEQKRQQLYNLKQDREVNSLDFIRTLA